MKKETPHLKNLIYLSELNMASKMCFVKGEQKIWIFR